MSDDDYFFESHLYVKRLNETINFIELKFSEHFNYINTKKKCFKYFYNNNKKFMKVDIIGEGSYGKVFKVYNKSHKNIVIKVTENNMDVNLREAKEYIKYTKIKKLRKYIPKIYYIFSDEDSIFIIMEEM